MLASMKLAMQEHQSGSDSFFSGDGRQFPQLGETAGGSPGERQSETAVTTGVLPQTMMSSVAMLHYGHHWPNLVNRVSRHSWYLM